ncbi:proline--tRNA ligase [Alienimonas chondri]|uniref:Proline--tRNA ligase n=1 Tax=Alienimonas chondri TaxID=2681879 RepID=A0ABX1V9G9_9PLAN|nr:proline--tRNA ligase [Alienimonas chondri]NNJ24038.1 Proline--tRNA ligase [Alienimonas chondri]
MRWSQTLVPTLKEVPADAEVPSHRLMLRAGLVRQVMAGAYTYLPLGWRAVRKAAEIVREEMEAAGAAELHFPAMSPIELWERSGRREAFGNVLLNFAFPRGDRKVHVALGPTHEEPITDLIKQSIASYKQLPLTLFQIQTKFRNEERPRFGVLRTSEFLMKDAYSFGTDIEQLNASYDAMYAAYCRIFERCGIPYLAVEAESGPIGGDASHEFMIPAENGEDSVVHCEASGYAANLERAETGRTAPQIVVPDDVPPMDAVATPGVSTIEAVCAALGVQPEQTLKTLLYTADAGTDEERTVAVVVRGDHDANEGKIRRAIGAATLSMADEATVRRVTGAPVGFAGPVGLEGVTLLADHDAVTVQPSVVGANSADAHRTNVCCGRDWTVETTHDLRDARAGDPDPKGGGPMKVVRGIEVGHVFKLGTKYSDALGAEYLGEDQKRRSVVMGCYGIGINRIVAGAIETSHDDRGIIWPKAIAPYQCHIIPLDIKDEEVMSLAQRFHDELEAAGVDCLLDDRKERPGVKFADADLIGLPTRITIGKRGLTEGVVEVKRRTDADPEKIAPDAAVARVRELLA